MIRVRNPGPTADGIQGSHVARVRAEYVIEAVPRSQPVTSRKREIDLGKQTRSVVSRGIGAGSEPRGVITELVENRVDYGNIRRRYRDQPRLVQIFPLKV